MDMECNVMECFVPGEEWVEKVLVELWMLNICVCLVVL